MTTVNDPGRGLLVKGWAAIGDYLGLTEREAQHQGETNGLPFFHLGRCVVARVETLDRWLDEQEQKPPPPKKEPEARPKVPLRRYG